MYEHKGKISLGGTRDIVEDIENKYGNGSFFVFLKNYFSTFLRVIRHLPFRTGEVVTLDIFNVDIVVFIFQFGNISYRCVWSAPLGPFKFVRLGVFGQVVGAHETFIANWTSETLFAGVGAQVTLEFVGAGEAFSAK